MRLFFILPLLFLATNATSQQNRTIYRMKIQDSSYTVFKDSKYDYTEWPMTTAKQTPFPFFASRVQRTNIRTFIKDTFYMVGQSQRSGPYQTNNKNLYIFQSPIDTGVIAIYNARWQMITSWVYGHDSTTLKKTLQIIRCIEKNNSYKLQVVLNNTLKSDKDTSEYKRLSNVYWKNLLTVDERPKAFKLFLKKD